MNAIKNIKALLLGLSICVLVACAGSPKTSTENTSADISRGLVAHWTMDQAQLKGTTLKDSAGAHDGLLVGGVTPIEGAVGGALELDGKSGYITFGNILNEVFSDQATPGKKSGLDQAAENWSKFLHLDGGGNNKGNKFSIAVWVKPSKLNKNTSLLVKSGDSACNPQKNERQFALDIGDGYKENNLVNLYSDTLWHKGFVLVNSPKPPPIDEWTHIVFNYDESVTTDPALRFGLYLNGEKQPLYTVVAGGSSAYKIEPGPAPLAMGIVVSSSGPCTRYDYFAGGVDDLRIYDRLLSEAEARQLARGASKLTASASTGTATSETKATPVTSGKTGAHESSIALPAATAAMSASTVSATQTARENTDNAQPVTAKAATAAPKLAGCWNWSNGGYIVVDTDGTARNGPFGASWKTVDAARGRYTITWPSFIDTLSLSADGSTLSGANNFGIPVSATRKSGKPPGIAGTWLWSSGVTMTIRPDSSVSGGAYRGQWRKAGNNWVFEWPLVDTVSLSKDGRSLSAKNQFGAITAKRDKSCKGS